MALLLSADADESLVHASLHGVLRRSELNYFSDNVRRAAGRSRGLAKSFLTKTLSHLESLDLSSFRDSVETLRNRYVRRWDEDRITLHTKLSDLQNSKPVMRRWLMANTRARKLYYGDKIYGYAGKFDQTEGEYYGDELRDYRNVMQGAYTGDENEDRFVTYLDILEDRDSDDILTNDQRDMILYGMELMERCLDAGGQDPTNPTKALL